MADIKKKDRDGHDLPPGWDPPVRRPDECPCPVKERYCPLVEMITNDLAHMKNQIYLYDRKLEDMMRDNETILAKNCEEISARLEKMNKRIDDWQIKMFLALLPSGISFLALVVGLIIVLIQKG